MTKKTSDILINQIKLLRKNGHSVPEISSALKIPKTTVFRYVADVEILPEFLNTWAGKRGGSKKRKLLKEEKALKEAQELIIEVTEKEKLLFLCALYWAEGSKGDFGLSNTDPQLIKVFISGLREVFGITNDQLRISIRIYEDLNRNECLSFWSKIVGITTKDFVNVNVLKGKKKGKLQYGMCRVRVKKGGDMLKKILAVNRTYTDAILKENSYNVNVSS